MNCTQARFVPLLVAVVAAFGIGIAVANSPLNFAIERQASAASRADDTLSVAESLSAAFEHVAQTVSPSVVTVRATKEVEAAPMIRGSSVPFFFQSPFGQSPFEDFFGGNGAPRFEMTPAPGQRQFQQGEGSGFIVRADGYILTNNHVVEGAEDVSVILSDDRQYTAEIVGVDPKTDIAVIKIDSDGLPAVRLGDSDALRVGQWVVAAGNPFGLASTITTGIVSAKGRTGVGITDYEDFIQTDAAINRGNSGGPLVNLRGEVVGINTAILSRSGGNNGVGFAIPINMAGDIMDELIAEGRVVRGFLGVMIQDLTDGMAGSFGYDSTNGALVSEVTEHGPAGKAGLRAGDIITRFGGEMIASTAQLRMRVADVDPGTDVELVVFRDGSTHAFDVTVGELPSGDPAKRPLSDDGTLGLTVETLTPRLAPRVGVDAGLTGVLVTAVDQLSPAGRAGLRRGDVITHVQGARVENAHDFDREVRRHDTTDGVRLTIQDGAQRRFVFVPLN